MSIVNNNNTLNEILSMINNLPSADGAGGGIEYTNIVYNDDNTITLTDKDGVDHTMVCEYTDGVLSGLTYDGKSIALTYEEDALVGIGAVEVDMESIPCESSGVPENALLAFTDYDETGLPRTLIYNCPDTFTQKELFYSNIAYNGFFATAIKNVILPNYVTTISEKTFGGLSSIETVSNWDYITRFEASCFQNNGGTYDKGRLLQHTHFPPKLEYIGNSAFSKNATKIASELPDTLTFIGDGAFVYGGNKEMTLTKLPPNLTHIGQEAFMGYFVFEKLDFPATIEHIKARAFDGRYHTKSLKTVVFRGTPITIDSSAFQSNTSLTDIYVPWALDEVDGAPWGATNANLTIHYNTTYDANGNPQCPCHSSTEV